MMETARRHLVVAKSSKGNTGRAVSSGSSAIVLGSIVNSLLFKGMCENILILCSTMACFLSM